MAISSPSFSAMTPSDLLGVGVLDQARGRGAQAHVDAHVGRDLVEVAPQLAARRVAALGPGHFAGHLCGLAVVAPDPVDLEVVKVVEPVGGLHLLLDDGAVEGLGLVVGVRAVVEVHELLEHLVFVVGAHAGLDAAGGAAQVAAVGLRGLLEHDGVDALLGGRDAGGHARGAVAYHDDVGFLVPCGHGGDGGVGRGGAHDGCRGGGSGNGGAGHKVPAGEFHGVFPYRGRGAPCALVARG